MLYCLQNKQIRIMLAIFGDLNAELNDKDSSPGLVTHHCLGKPRKISPYMFKCLVQQKHSLSAGGCS